jgi:hypothetical protein
VSAPFAPSAPLCSIGVGMPMLFAPNRGLRSLNRCNPWNLRIGSPASPGARLQPR